MTLVELVLRILGVKPKAEAQPEVSTEPSATPLEVRDAFAKILAFTLSFEGGYVNNPADPGGRTIYGISERAHPELWKDGTPTLDDAKTLYRAEYWGGIRGDELPPRTAMVLFDFYVHSRSSATKTVQRLVGLTGKQVDGVLGPQSLAAIRAAVPDAETDRTLAFRLLAERGLFLGRWIAAAGTRAQFAPGFMRRLVELAALIARY